MKRKKGKCKVLCLGSYNPLNWGGCQARKCLCPEGFLGPGGQADCELAMSPSGKTKTSTTLGCSIKTIG